jgi:hypothetical protein
MVAAYYEEVQRVHAERVQEAWRDVTGLRGRLSALLHLKLDILKDDRQFLGALFRYTGEPNHPLSVFGSATRPMRAQSMALFREALSGTSLNEELGKILPPLLWMGHLGILLALIHDESVGQIRTRKLVDGAVEMFVQAIEWGNSALVRPFLQPFQKKVLHLMQDADWA